MKNEITEHQKPELANLDKELIQSFYDMIKDAASHKSSDIHIEVRGDCAKVRYLHQISREIHHVKDLTSAFVIQLLKRVYFSEVDATLFDPGSIQDAYINKKIGDQEIQIRLATFPVAPDGFDWVMRLLKVGKGGSLNELGYTDDHFRQIKDKLAAKNNENVIINGTCGYL